MSPVSADEHDSEAPAPAQLALPRRVSLDGLTILDVGCGDGYALTYPEFAGAAELHGIDVDGDAIRRGCEKYPHLKLQVAGAEALPYPERTFGVVMARVSLPYTDVPAALAEACRVLRPGGYLFISMHDFRMQWGWLTQALKRRAWKRVFDHAYIIPASVAYHLTGHCLPRPWNGRHETFQTHARMLKDVTGSGFDLKETRRTERHWIFEAFKNGATARRTSA